MRKTRVIYVENDPALRGILGDMLAAHPRVELLASAASPDEALACPRLTDADVALIDLALGAGVMNGIDLGLALRSVNQDMGIVIHSQHEPAQVLRRFPSDDIMGWSFVPKTGNMSLDELVAMLVSTARGMSTVDSHATHETGTGSTRLSALTDRQRAVMALAAEGLNAPEIARRLGRSSESVRQDLSRAYRVLTPATGEGEDRRTRAVMEYLRLMREESWDSL